MKKSRRKDGRGQNVQIGQQYAALPWRDDGGLEILLVTSRETRRWVIPKGWPMKGKQPHAAAAREALEEAGVTGRIAKRPIGAYSYIKRLKNGAPLQCSVDVFPLKVVNQRTRWPEQGERTAHWFTPDEAATAVDEPELQALIDAFAHLIAADAARKTPKASKAAHTPAAAAETPPPETETDGNR
jgi:8-oxo-dGTP pyrophosphatase MutT (NUDIX family)